MQSRRTWIFFPVYRRNAEWNKVPLPMLAGIIPQLQVLDLKECVTHAEAERCHQRCTRSSIAITG
jgi:hypothetical protein